jgi:tetratricopeptide (TPR) repeat protein
MEHHSEATHARSLLASALLLVLGAIASSTPASAVGGSQSSSGNGGGVTACPRGQVYSQRSRQCVQARSEVLTDENLAEYAFALAKANRFDEALDTLNMVQNLQTPRVLNYRGYITRKLGRTEEGIGYYLQSVALDPNYTQVREYLGEAYVTQGKLDLANEQLQTIQALCGTQCEEYEDLADAIQSASAAVR